MRSFLLIRCLPPELQGYQLAGAMFIIGWNLVWTSLILLFIKHVLRIPLQMTEAQLLEGDDAVHGEAAYTFGPCEAHDHEGGYIQGRAVQVGDNSGDDAHDELEAEKIAAKNGESSEIPL